MGGWGERQLHRNKQKDQEVRDREKEKKRHTGEDLKKDNPKLSKIILSSSEENKIYLINW